MTSLLFTIIIVLYIDLECGLSSNAQTGVPVLTISPSSNPIRIVTGDSVTLTVTANMTLETLKCYHNDILKQTGHNTTTTSYPISRATTSDKGVYKCNGTTSDGSTGSVSTNVDVQYSPSVNILPIARPYILFVNQTNIQLTCKVTANPDNSTIKWTKDASTQSLSTSSTYKINKVQKNTAGQFKCTATNIIGSAHATIPIQVHFGPGNSIKFNTSNNVKSITLTENMPTDSIQCSATCNPACSFTWKKNNHKASFRNPLTFTKVSKMTMGVYTCTAKNTVQNSSRTGDLNVTVLYSPSITSFTIVGGNVSEEGNAAIFRCEVDSNPGSNIIVKSMKNGTLAVKKQSTKSCNMSIEQVTCLDSGPYQCEANNTVVGKANKKINFYVKCKPRLDSRIDGLSKRNFKSVAKGDIMSISLAIIAYPVPDVKWLLRDRSGIYRPIREHTYNVNISMVSDFAEHTVRLTMHNFTDLDYGEYSATVTNAQGKDVYTYIITEPISPETTDIAPIVGGAVGALLIILIMIVVIIMIRRRGLICRRNKNVGRLGDEEMYENQAFSDDLEAIKKPKNNTGIPITDTTDGNGYESFVDRSRTTHHYDTPQSVEEGDRIPNKLYANVDRENDLKSESDYANVESNENETLPEKKTQKYIYENTTPGNKPILPSGKEKVKKRLKKTT